MQSELTRRTFLQRTALTTTAGAAVLSTTLFNCGPRKKPNILWIISEDTCPDLGCYGNEIVHTPHLDKLASEGTLFTKAYATAPVCSPARSAFMTGMYQTTIGAQQHRTFYEKPLPEPVQVITEYFRQEGYFVSNGQGTVPESSGKKDWNFIIENPAFDGTDWRQREEGQPFFSQFNFRLTHRKFERDPERPIDADQVDVPPYYPDHPITRRDWANYLESLQVLDRQIGALLQRLEDDGLAEDTIVFYFGDHGRPHVRGKQWLYEGGIHVPLIVRWPGHVKAGKVDDQLVSLIDLAPTSMKSAGIKPPDHLQGKDVLGRWNRKRSEIYAARDRCDGTVDRIRCVRDGRYKLIKNYYPERPYTQFNGYKKFRYPALTLMQILHEKGELTPAQQHFMANKRPEYELYDLQNDPHEIDNKADDPDYADVKNKLQTKLEKWVQKTDNGTYPEDQEKVQQAIEKMHRKFKERMASRGLSVDISNEEYLEWWKDYLAGELSNEEEGV